MKIKEDQPAFQTSELKNIGRVLREKREELSFSLEHISEISRISLSSLRNIEEGNLKELPGLVFVRGFIRNYAKLLGIDSDWMVKKLNESFAESDVAASPKDNTHINHSTTEDNYHNFINKYINNQNGMLWAAIGLFIVITIVIGTWTYSALLPDENDRFETIQAIESNSIDPNKQPSTISNTNIPEVVPPKTVISPLNLVLIGNQNEWIRLSIDSEPAIEQKLKVGEKYEWPANEIYELTMTDGNTARIYLNGEEIEVNASNIGQLYHKKLNKFSLTQLNN